MTPQRPSTPVLAIEASGWSATYHLVDDAGAPIADQLYRLPIVAWIALRDDETGTVEWQGLVVAAELGPVLADVPDHFDGYEARPA